jgi:hypothetical protein
MSHPPIGREVFPHLTPKLGTFAHRTRTVMTSKIEETTPCTVPVVLPMNLDAGRHDFNHWLAETKNISEGS